MRAVEILERLLGGLDDACRSDTGCPMGAAGLPCHGCSLRGFIEEAKCEARNDLTRARLMGEET